VLLVRRELSLAVSRTELRYLLGFSSQVSGQNLVFYVINTAPSWLISRTFGGATLGLYSRANLLIGLPVTHLATGLTKALYPLYARVSGDGRKAAALIEDALGTASFYVWPAFAAIAGAASSIVAVLLGEGWGKSAALLPIIALMGCFNLPSAILFNAAEAFRWMRFTWTAQAAWVTVTALGLAAVVAAGSGPAAIVWVVALTQVAVHALQIAYFCRRGFLRARVLLTRYAFSAGFAAAVFGIVRLAEVATHDMTPLAQLAAEGLAAAAVAAVALAARQRAVRTGRGDPGADLATASPATVNPAS
jgi:O-antigen/teichoic acid export membrane protein